LILTQWPALRLQAAPVSLFLLSVMFSAWLGGVAPGLLATALSALAFYYYLLPPSHSLAAKPEETPRLIVFAVSLLLVGLLTAAQSSTTASLWRARDDLLGTVQQLQRSNEALQAESSERKRAEEKLEQSEAYLSEAQRLSRTGSFGWRPSTGEIFLSEETFRIFQYDPATKPTVELALQRVHPDDAALMRETIERASKEGKDFEHEYRLMMPDGTVKHVHVVAHAERDELGDLEFVGAVMDVSDRKRAEEELRRTEALAEQRLRLVVDTTPAMINTLRPDGYLDYVNKGWLDYFGFSLDTALDRADVMKMSPPSEADMYEGRWQPIIHPEDLPGFTDQWKSMLVSGKPGEREARVRRFDGVYRWHLFRAVPLHDEAGKPVKWYASAFDIEDRKNAEEALRRSESYLAEAQRFTHTGSWAWRIAGRDAVHLSEEWYRIYGFDPETGPPVWEQRLQRVHPEDRARWQGPINRAIAEKSDYEVEFRIVLPDGTVKYIHTVGHPVLNASGELTEFVGSSTDITERKQAEEALRRSEGYLAEAQRLTHTGSWAWRVAGRDALHLSEEWYRIYGFDPEEGLSAWEKRLQRTHPEDRAKWQGAVDRAVAEKSDYEVEFRIVLPDGIVKYIHAVGHPVLNAAGDVVQFVGSSMDITEPKRAEEALRQAQADLAHVSRVTTMGELTASLAHEVKQPITAASTNATTCLRWLAGDTPNIEEARAAAKRIVEDGKRAAEIISRIRLLFKKGPPERESVDVNEVIREMTVMLRSEAMRYSISVRTELAADLPQVVGDRVQLQQVMMNLIMNSIDAMKEVDGTRELAIKSQRADGEQLLVSVSDTGIGLPPQQTGQIFNAFFTTKPHGTGMGLRISRSILESHGGRLWADDNSPRGASFYLTLPAKATRAAKAKAHQ
jgi:PAS domain S-box-containing protein